MSNEMNKNLFIGGPWDGCRENVSEVFTGDRSVVKVPDYFSSEPKYVSYYSERFKVGGLRSVIYRFEGLSLEEMFIKLLAGYRA